MQEMDAINVAGLRTGAALMPHYVEARAQIGSNELGRAALSLSTGITQLTGAPEFWTSADWLANNKLSSAANVREFGRDKFFGFEHCLLTGRLNDAYPGPYLQEADAVDLVTRVSPFLGHGITLDGPGTGRLKKVTDASKSIAERLAFDLKTLAEHPDSLRQPTTRELGEPGPSKFGRLLKGIGRAMLFVGGAIVTGTNTYAVVGSGFTATPAFGSMGAGLGAMATALYDDPDPGSEIAAQDEIDFREDEYGIWIGDVHITRN